MGSNFMDELDCSSFFDHIDDLIEFPPENDSAGSGSADCKNFPSIWNDPLPVSDHLFSGGNNNSASHLSAELSLPYEDIMQLEWLSTFMEDAPFVEKENTLLNMEPPPLQSKFSPVSVLENSSSSSSSSCSRGKTIQLSPTRFGAQRARSKRPRPAAFVPAVSSESENFAESPIKPEGEKKKKLIRFSVPLAPADPNQNQAAQGVRKCVHCEITKTPQWRAGPMGPKTLCNACGVRYKSGRLFPEYRPAASPTFVPSVHSNSHKKVIEMRCKVSGIGKAAMTMTEMPTFPQPDFQ